MTHNKSLPMTHDPLPIKGFCLPAGPYVSDEDVKYIVDCIKEAIVK